MSSADKRVVAGELDESLMQAAVEPAQVQIDVGRLVLAELARSARLAAFAPVFAVIVEQVELDGSLAGRAEVRQLGLDRQRDAARDGVGRQLQGRDAGILRLAPRRRRSRTSRPPDVLGVALRATAAGLRPTRSTAGQIGEDVDLFPLLARSLSAVAARLPSDSGQRRADGARSSAARCAAGPPPGRPRKRPIRSGQSITATSLSRGNCDSSHRAVSRAASSRV